MTKKRTQIELLEEISNKLSIVIDQLNNVLNYEPNVVELYTSTEDNYTEVVNNEQKGLYSLKYIFQEENRTESNTQWGDINNPSY